LWRTKTLDGKSPGSEKEGFSLSTLGSYFLRNQSGPERVKHFSKDT
jgi:hypothetical protein